MYTARRFDPETGLYYYRARTYSPQIGRFLQTDPIGYGDGMNMYSYVSNNPLNFVDPWGLEAKTDDGVVFSPLAIGFYFSGVQKYKVLKPVGALGSKRGTTIASFVLRKTFPKRIAPCALGARTAGGLMARGAVPIVGWFCVYCEILYRYGVDPNGPPYRVWKNNYIKRYGVHYWPGSGL